MTTHADSLAYPPRGLSREEAARYVGVGVSLFDEMVADRRMPKPKRFNNRRVWDRVALDAAFTDAPGSDENRIDQLFAQGQNMRKVGR
jgi:predicted DNA-binding transcriptional regulator AlpA